MSEIKMKPIHEPDRIINYWRKEKFVVFCIFMSGLLFNGGMVLGPIYQGKLIDSIVKKAPLSGVIRLAAVFVLMILSIQLLRYIKRFYIRRFANSASATMRFMIYNHIMNKSITELQKESTGDLMSRAISDVELCVEGMRKFTTEVFDTGVLMVSYLITLLIYDVKIAVLSVLFIPLAMLLAEKLKGFIYRYSVSYRKKTGEVTGITYEYMEHAMLYRITGLEEANRENYDRQLTELQEKAIKANILENSMQPVYNIIAMTGVLAVIYLGGDRVIHGDWSIGTFTAFFNIFVAMAVKASKASKLFNSVQKSQVSWRRVKPYLTEYRQKNTSVAIKEGNTRLEVKALGMSYGEGQDSIIGEISFEAKEGEIIGITGPVASGKSSLGLALTGLYPYLGSIRVDGKELSEYSEYERSRLIAYLGHSPELLSDTLYQNITLGEDKDITEVLKNVCFVEDLAAMPEGKDTLVGNGGVRLSGGQQSRVALARALLNHNKLIILDDPFSAVDMRTERRIIENLRRHYKESIIILISHRLAIFKEIDRILLMDGDRTTEYGTHEQLMENSRLYSDIYRLQELEDSTYEK
jgi:ABC-type multidrug transport system fused ATPase/permease subunit